MPVSGRAAAAAAKRRRQQLALEADVDDAGALRIEAGEAGEDQRHGEADRSSVEDRLMSIEVHQLASRRLGRANSRASGARSMSPIAPVNRITSAWMVTIISRVMPGI